MIIALWVILVLLLVWISLSELPAGWDGHAPLPYLIALSPFAWIGITAVAIWARLPARMAAYGVCNRWLDRFTPTQNRVLHE